MPAWLEVGSDARFAAGHSRPSHRAELREMLFGELELKEPGGSWSMDLPWARDRTLVAHAGRAVKRQICTPQLWDLPFWFVCFLCLARLGCLRFQKPHTGPEQRIGNNTVRPTYAYLDGGMWDAPPSSSLSPMLKLVSCFVCVGCFDMFCPEPKEQKQNFKPHDPP